MRLTFREETDMKQRRIPGTTAVARTDYRSGDGSVVHLTRAS